MTDHAPSPVDDPRPGSAALSRALVVLRVALPLAITILALFVLHRMATDISWAALRDEIGDLSSGAIALAFLSTGLSFLAISQIDAAAVRALGLDMPWKVASATGAAAVAVANMLGFAIVTGMSVRYRVYAAYGIDVARLSSVFGATWLSYFLAIATVVAILLLGWPAIWFGASGIGTDPLLGVATLLIIGAVIGWLWRGPRALRLREWEFRLPSGRMTLVLAALSAIDLVTAAAVIWVLLPADLGVGPAQVFVVFLAAISLGTASHAPGGIGVFEATMIAGLGAGGRADVLAALVLYRVIYYLVPFLCAVLGLAAVWGGARRESAGRIAGRGYRLALPIVPPLAAAMATLGGIVLLVSGSLPAVRWRISTLGDLLPLGVIEASHLIGSVVGVLLLVLARGLWRRLHRAWAAVTALLILGAVLSLAKGLDWEEALILLSLAGAMALFRPAFYRRGAGSLRLTARWLVSLVVLLGVVLWIGLFAYSNVDYRDALWWEVALSGDASRYLRASLVAAVTLGCVAFAQLVWRDTRRIVPEPIPDAVRRLVAESPVAEPNIDLLGDKAFLVDPEGRAFLAYADTGRALISKGDPVGDREAGRALLWQLREQADRMGRLCAFYAVSPDWLPAYIDLGLDILKIGELARVDLSGFGLEGKARKDLRYYIGRAKREGFDFEIVPRDRVPAEMEALRAVSEAWRRDKPGGEKGFTMGRFDPEYLSNFDHAVFRDRETGRIAAFANIMRGAEGEEVSVDLMRYDPEAKGVSMDALFGELMLWAKAEGYRWFSLGSVPFAGLEARPLAPLWARLGGFVYTHGERIYGFEGLHGFKTKFDPVWTGNYLAAPGGISAARILYDVNVLVSGGIRGLMK
ncbi:bifunctional lysylphosphatidylglycerol flippase/synthetase MprF [Palleronia sp. LCG004]|uniref:bifunctional lysylphosphatidylglycerol flippase/synthetase MprF n=1 Tax=Palleronia sp. LCG004 TaxID=3079304 RepID=UPI002943AC48|nr:bifunctional lysylphosphatidylglycerol flippase/synthetase MprF [Palleronia sp. LCG004]WOI57987.1 bifunctional lysylphosphatidylglycerol flippase/synthetase MprF [Palleronia sp. LCG004]